MKVTVINNGQTSIILKAEKPSEILALKDFQEKTISTKFHETTQIIEESYPNCLVIKVEENTKQQEKKWMGLFDRGRDNKCIAMLPTNTTTEGILSYIKKYLSNTDVTLDLDEDGLIGYGTPFSILDGLEPIGEYFIESVNIVTEW